MHSNQTAYLARAVGWAHKHGLKVLVDLHGAPGSQNGFANSGRTGPVQFQDDPFNAVRAGIAVGLIGQAFSAQTDVVTHIEILNEPVLDRSSVPALDTFTKNYYNVAYWLTQRGYKGVIHDGFLPLSSWNGFLPGSTLDTHIFAGLYQYHGVSGTYIVVIHSRRRIDLAY